MANKAEAHRPSNASGGGTRKELKKAYGKGHSSSIPKAVKYKQMPRAARKSGRFSGGANNSMFS